MQYPLLCAVCGSAALAVPVAINGKHSTAPGRAACSACSSTAFPSEASLQLNKSLNLAVRSRAQVAFCRRSGWSISWSCLPSMGKCHLEYSCPAPFCAGVQLSVSSQPKYTWLLCCGGTEWEHPMQKHFGITEPRCWSSCLGAERGDSAPLGDKVAQGKGWGWMWH